MKTRHSVAATPKNHPVWSDDNALLDKLLRLPNEAFLHAAYRRLLGRNPDIAGLARYGGLLEQHGRVLVLAELRASPEGQKMAHLLVSDKLDRVARRYKLLRSLPLGNLRWRLLESMLISPASLPTVHGTHGTAPASAFDAFDASAAAHQRDVYWITRIAGQRAQSNYDDIADAATSADPEALIRHLYRTRDTTNA